MKGSPNLIGDLSIHYWEVNEYEDGELDIWNHNDHCRNGRHTLNPLDIECHYECFEKGLSFKKRGIR
jgi:hypothetical protein